MFHHLFPSSPLGMTPLHEPLNNLKHQSHEDCKVLSAQEFVTTTRFLLCSYVGALKYGYDFILYTRV